MAVAYQQRASLAGTCGIPNEEDRVRVRVDYSIEGGLVTERSVRPQRIHWADGRSWTITSIYECREFGRRSFGNLCICWTVCIAGCRRELWWEHGDWFVEKCSGIAGRPMAQG